MGELNEVIDELETSIRVTNDMIRKQNEKLKELNEQLKMVNNIDSLNAESSDMDDLMRRGDAITNVRDEFKKNPTTAIRAMHAIMKTPAAKEKFKDWRFHKKDLIKWLEDQPYDIIRYRRLTDFVCKGADKIGIEAFLSDKVKEDQNETES